MKRFYVRTKSNIERAIIGFREADYDFVRLHIGNNSIFVFLTFFIFWIVALNQNKLNWDYLKGFDSDLAFFVGFFSLIFGLMYHNYWNFGGRSQYVFHFSKAKFIPDDANILLDTQEFQFGISKYYNEKTQEFPVWLRRFFCVAGFFCLAVITLDNRGFNTIKDLPNATASDAGYCPDREEAKVDDAPKPECALIIRAFELGYAKDLGPCEPKEIEAEHMEICEKRRKGEPLFHYMSRMMTKSVVSLYQFFGDDKFERIKKKFEMQLEKIEPLKDYQAYAISAAPRASHHIWTNLPYPIFEFQQNFRDLFNPGWCLEQFQNQTNSIRVRDDDKRKDSKLLEHVYGHLLFNPKVKLTVGFCKEYTIHWNAKPNTCDRLISEPQKVLQESEVLDEVNLVLRRLEIAQVVSDLDKQFQDKKPKDKDAEDGAADDESVDAIVEKARKTLTKKGKKKISTAKIDKEAQQFRKKNELVSFQCFMREEKEPVPNKDQKLQYHNTEFLVKTRSYKPVKNAGESQINMYQQFAKLMESNFRYSQYNSLTDIPLEDSKVSSENEAFLEEPTYMLTRLEILNNIDIFLGDDWVLDRADLLEVYPFHVHLQNYVDSFRKEYKQSRGRL